MSADFDETISNSPTNFDPSETDDAPENDEGWTVEDDNSQGVDDTEQAPVFERDEWAPPIAAGSYNSESYNSGSYRATSENAASPPTDPVTPVPNNARSSAGRGRQFVAGIAIGALIGGAVGGGVAALVSRGDTQIIAQPNPVVTEVRNTSRLAIAQDIQSLIGRVEPAVVAIRTGAAVDEGLFTGRGPSSGGEGTGFVISSDGVIVTNSHVIEGASGRIEVVFNDGTVRKATVLGSSPELDLAVVQAANVSGLPIARLGSSDELVVGDDVVAIGNALALDGTLSVTRGIISAKGRTVSTSASTSLLNMLQTDAAINPGNSGGPLLNSRGEVIGINTAIADPGDSQNVGFAIAIDSARPIIDQLRAGKDIELAYLGIQSKTVTPAIAKDLNLVTQTGAVIVKVTPGTGAADAGLKVNDVIVAVGSNEVRRADDVGSAIRGQSPGATLKITVERDGARKVIEVRLGAVPLSEIG